MRRRQSVRVELVAERPPKGPPGSGWRCPSWLAAIARTCPASGTWPAGAGSTEPVCTGRRLGVGCHGGGTCRDQ